MKCHQLPGLDKVRRLRCVSRWKQNADGLMVMLGGATPPIVPGRLDFANCGRLFETNLFPEKHCIAKNFDCTYVSSRPRGSRLTNSLMHAFGFRHVFSCLQPSDPASHKRETQGGGE